MYLNILVSGLQFVLSMGPVGVLVLNHVLDTSGPPQPRGKDMINVTRKLLLGHPVLEQLGWITSRTGVRGWGVRHFVDPSITYRDSDAK